MSLRIGRAALGAFTLLTIAACGDDSNGPSGPTPEQYFPASMVETFGSTGRLLGEYAVQAIDFGGTNVGLSAGANGSGTPALAAGAAVRLQQLLRLEGVGPQFSASLASPTCTPDQTGAATDTDADGIPDLLTITYTPANCTVTDTATGDVTVIRGKITYRDISNDLHGFDIVVDELRQDTYVGSSQEWFHGVIDAHETARTTSTGGTWSLTASALNQLGTGDVVDQTSQVAYSVTGKYTSNGSVPAGGPMPDGTVTLSGTIDATLPASGRLVVKLLTTNALHYESSCPGNDTGEVELRLNGNPAEGVLVRWIGCNSAAYEFLGSGTL